jgi:DNA-binding transcriptional ArsR family regulator
MNIDEKRFCAGAEAAEGLLKALANANRLMILCRLHKGECAVGELESFVGLNQSALSQHLARLRRDGIVATRRDAQTIFYRIRDRNAVRIMKDLYGFFCDAPRREGRA